MIEAERQAALAQYRYDRETAVMDALPHAVHPMHDNWRTKAQVLIKELEKRGWAVLSIGVYEPHSQATD